jgi:N-acetylmuramoyl-L-alanine amidase
MARWSEAAWRPVKNHGGARPKGQPSIVVMHHAVANGSLYNVFNGSRQASTDFWIAKDGRAEQYVDTAMTSWGNGNSTANQRGISVETEGCGAAPHAEPMTDAMVNTFARLMAWANRTHGVPLRKTESFDTPGFGYHRMRGGFATACPCDVRLRMRDEILRRAQGQAPSPEQPPTTEEVELVTSAVADSGVFNVFVVGPARGTIWDTWQRPNENNWNGGAPGKSIAGLRRFAEAPQGRTIRGIEAEVAANGNLHVFATLDDGSTWYTWQAKGSTGWSGGQPGRVAALAPFAPRP